VRFIVEDHNSAAIAAVVYNPPRGMDEPDPNKPAPAPVALLLRLWDDGEAEIIRQILLEHDIPSRVESDVSHALFPLNVDGLGEIRIFVPEDRLDEAEQILADYRRRALEIVEPPPDEDARS
jgi:hypothetical protein